MEAVSSSLLRGKVKLSSQHLLHGVQRINNKIFLVVKSKPFAKKIIGYGETNSRVARPIIRTFPTLRLRVARFDIHAVVFFV